MVRLTVINRVLPAFVGSRVLAFRACASIVFTLSVLASVFSGTPAGGADFTVVYGGSRNYTINGLVNTPILRLVRGVTYTFEVNTGSNHPFFIRSTGVSNNNSFSGTIAFTVPTVVSNYSYLCSVHGFGNVILTFPPPEVRITGLTLSNDLVLQSTGASNYSVVPEFKAELTTTNWQALTVQTNRFLAGTNETICGRPPDGNVFIRVKALRR